MYIRTQDGKSIIPCEAIDSRFNEKYNTWDIVSLSLVTGKSVKLLGSYHNQSQYTNILAELEGGLAFKRKIYYMPPDVQAIQRQSYHSRF